MFAAVMQDNHIAKLVGDRTGGDGCGFMTDGAPILLRHSRLRFRVPNCMRLRADGTNEEAGILPDLAVLPIEGESERARGERAILVIAEDLAKQPEQLSLCLSGNCPSAKLPFSAFRTHQRQRRWRAACPKFV